MGFDFDRQRPIDNYIVDFYCKDLMLAIEVDGFSHSVELATERDLIRQTRLEKLGVRFLRFDNDDIKTNINGVVEIIRAWISEHPELVGRMDSPPDPFKEGSYPPPSLSREGSLKRKQKDKQFHFKKFSVRHDRSGMKVGTDGVLLGAWADVSQATHILDIGTGTGVIALMLAQRTQPFVKIEAIEIDKHAFEDVKENFISSPWSDRLMLHHGSVQDFTPTKQFDLIVSNPPYFQSSFKPANAKRVVARHTENLSFLDLLQASKRHLSEKGALNVVLPYTEGLQFISLASQNGFHCSRKWSFKSREDKPVERLLLEFLKNPTATKIGQLVLYNASKDEEWSEEYCKLTKEFYLKL
jgi:tRNA1Val (adenine37-N6)-methyltransferase